MNKHKKIIVLLSAVSLLVAMISTVGWAAGNEEAGPIKLGVIAPLSGGGTSYGIGIKQGAEMAVEEVNQSGGVNGRQIELVIVDDASNPAESVTAMKRLLDHEKVDVIVGGWGSSQVLAHQGTVEKSEVPYIIVGATNPKITTKRNKWTFRVIKSDAIQAIEIANAAVDKMGLKSIAVIYDSNDYGTGNKDVFVDSLETRGIKPVALESYKTADKEFTAQLSKIKNANPNGLAVFGTIPAAPAIMIQARNLGINAQFIGTGGLANEQLIGLGGAAVEGTVLTTYFHEDTNTAATQWALRYKEKYASSSNPPRPILAAWEYRAIKQIMVPCLEKAGTDKEKVRQALKAFKAPVIGFDEAVYFDETNQLVQPTVLLEVKAGKFVIYK